ncbi:MAG: DUF192 domain-containing protein [Saprospiraceae bacterium]|nr:DUF192 domain-containing protein [Saprospiraceae bacterium]
MAKKKNKKQQRGKNSSSTIQQSPKQRRMLIILVALMIPAVIGLIFFAIPKNSGKKSGMTEPTFNHEGFLSFYENDQSEPIKEIDIEFADNEFEIEKGMMWRKSMEEDQGMLFMMPTQQPQTFWMLNTYIPLDLIFINEDLKVVSIQKNTVPQSLDPIPSNEPARYVLEVVGGFSDKFGVKPGTTVTFEKK